MLLYVALVYVMAIIVIGVMVNFVMFVVLVGIVVGLSLFALIKYLIRYTNEHPEVLENCGEDDI